MPKWILDLYERKHDLRYRLLFLVLITGEVMEHEEECELIRAEYQTIEQQINAWETYLGAL